MILPGGPMRVFVATKPVDFRKGIDGLAALAQQELRLDPFSGVALVFRAKRADRVKILVWDGSGMVLIAKPPVSGGVMRLSSAQFAALFEGLDWRRVHARRTPRPTIAG